MCRRHSKGAGAGDRACETAVAASVESVGAARRAGEGVSRRRGSLGRFRPICGHNPPQRQPTGGTGREAEDLPGVICYWPATRATKLETVSAFEPSRMPAGIAPSPTPC